MSENNSKSTNLDYGLIRYDKSGFEAMNIKLVDGSYPKNIDEILVENRVSNKNNIKIGDKISIAGENKKVVGIYSNYRYVIHFT